MHRYLNVRSKLVLLYLRGLRGIFENKQIHMNRSIYSLAFGLYTYYWCRQNLIKHKEFDAREQPNFLIPKFIYQSRREHYIFWEQSRLLVKSNFNRLARGRSSTFSYYDWDPNSSMIFYVDKNGHQTTERNIFSRERLDILDNPLFEEIFRNHENMDANLFKRANLLVAYQKNINNRYDLDNYLCHKPITVGDVARSIFYNIYVQLNLTNRYRYDQFIPKSDDFYEFEKIKIALDLNSRQTNSQHWVTVYLFYLEKFQKLL